jgi:dipeptidyl aminopeptidase/acylaminoacyl peptidase
MKVRTTAVVVFALAVLVLSSSLPPAGAVAAAESASAVAAAESASAVAAAESAAAVAAAESAGAFGAPTQEKRLFAIEDIFELARVGDPRISPEGGWVAYTVSRTNLKQESSDTDIWMAPLDGGEPVRLTTSDKSESSPRWSPDGKYLAFLSGRDGNKTQVWLLPRMGGEAFRLTDYKTGVSSFVWSPDSTRLAVVVRDEDPEESEEKAEEDEGGRDVPKPIVVTRLQFKRDGVGYLNDLKSHIYIFDVASKKSVQLTEGPYDDGSPAWSPDGNMIAFVSNRTVEPDANENSDIFVVAAEAGAEPRKLTGFEGSDSSPEFTPDGTHIVFLRGGDPADVWYDTNDLAVIAIEAPSSSGAGRDGDGARLLAPDLDRNVRGATITADGANVVFVVEDRTNSHLARVPLVGGEVEKIVAGERSIGAFDMADRGEIVVLEGQTTYPAEISKVVGDGLQRLTHVNDDFLAGIELADVTRHEATSADGTVIDFFLTLPPRAAEGERLPTLLRIHGGPVSQFSNSFNEEWQILAAHGYAVVAANPRGSSGRGRDFSRAIFADWGNKDFQDVMAAVDEAIEMGVADPDRLGVGGWSYGGILTNYVITQTGRFKAAISGASEVNYTANYGHDHYQRVWVDELGFPWENTDLWIELSPFFNVDKVTTPTLVMGGQLDWNVPLQNSEQLYQALRKLGVATQLVIYPGQGHGIRQPSYQVDRYERYLAWYDKYVKGEES